MDLLKIPKKLFSTIKIIIQLIKKWYQHMLKTLFSDDGWKLIVSFVTGVFILLGVFQAWLSHTTNHYSTLIESLDKKYYSMTNDLYSNNKWLRINALQRMNDIMISHVPKNINPSFKDGFQYLLYRNIDSKAVYHDESRRVLSLYLRNITTNSEKWSQEEMLEIINLLTKLGRDGWYHANQNQNQIKKEKALLWLWENNENYRDIENYKNPYILFKGLKFNGLNFNNYDFSKAYLKGTQFSHTKMKNVIFNLGTLEDANLSNALLNYSKLIRVNAKNIDLSNSVLYGATIKNSDLQSCTGINANMMSVNVSWVKFINCNFLNATFSNSTMKNSNFSSSTMQNILASKTDFSNSNFSFSELGHSKFHNATLRHCKFKLANMRKSTLSKSDITGCDFTGTDLREANFEGVIGIESVISWEGANIAKIKGLDNKILDILLSKGAVNILNQEKWNEYKTKGIGRH